MQIDSDTTGQLVGIARRAARRLPMEEVDAAEITVAAGLEGDHKGGRFPDRQVTVLSVEAWRLAAEEAGQPALNWQPLRYHRQNRCQNLSFSLRES